MPESADLLEADLGWALQIARYGGEFFA